MTYSTGIWARAQTLMPGGVNSPVRAFKAVGGDPLFFARGQGPYLFDLNNKKYIDFVGAWGPIVLGHAAPSVIEAVTKAAQAGLGFGAPNPLEVEMAEEIIQAFPKIEQIRMVSTGTEATQTAIRLARGFTKRKKILKFEGCYHGHVDALLVKAGSGALTFGTPTSLGVLEDLAQHTLIAPYNDIETTKALFEKYGSDIAGVIVEPIAANMNCVLPDPSFLTGLRQLCKDYGSLLIFDEIITGFRVCFGGAQHIYNIEPDITCLGKIIGGGLPLAALGGSKEIMSVLSPLGGVYQAGTLSGNPVALAAGLATLRELKKPHTYERLSALTQYFTESLKNIAAHYAIPLTLQSCTGIFGLFFTEQKTLNSYDDVSRCSVENFKQFFHGMLEHGVYFAPSAFEVGFMSLAHTESLLDYTLEASHQVFKQWKNH